MSLYVPYVSNIAHHVDEIFYVMVFEERYTGKLSSTRLLVFSNVCHQRIIFWLKSYIIASGCNATRLQDVHKKKCRPYALYRGIT